MPFALSALISRRANRFKLPLPTSSTSHGKLYFPPGGHTHDRHTIPPDRLHISFSDPVLVAAEQRLSTIPNAHRRGRLWFTRARKSARPGPAVFRPRKDAIQNSGDYTDRPLVPEAVDPLDTVSNSPGTMQVHCRMAGFQEAAAHLLEPSDRSSDVSEVMMISGETDGSPGNADGSASGNSQYRFDLAPLASEMFKEELYISGYLQRPASRSSNAVLRKPRTRFMSVSRKVFPRVLGRRQGRKVAECLRAGQGTAETPGWLDAHFTETSSTSVASVTLGTPHVDDLESPAVDTNTSVSESFDLHEFSYITAFTTPPSSPSIILDAETFKKGVDLADGKHAV